MSLTREEMIDMVFVLGECDRNPLLSSRVYAQRYPGRIHPRRKAFQQVLDRFLNTGSIVHSKRNRQKTIATEENEFLVLLSILENPQTSVRQISHTTGISATSIHRLIKKNSYHPYRIQIHQELLEVDFQRRLEFCQWALEMINQDDDFFKRVMFSDEATFHRNGFTNRHNCHYYDTVNPHQFRTTHSQNRWSLNVWGGILGSYVIGPFFFDEHLTGPVYLNFLTNTLDDLLSDIPLAILQRMWMQHDGAPPHNAAAVRQFLHESLPNRWIGRGGPVSWPSRSPDLTSCDFFLWGFIKSKVYVTTPTTVENMRQRITAAFQEITPDMLTNVEQSFKNRIRLCINQNGGHFEQL